MNEVDKMLRDLKGAHQLSAQAVAAELGVSNVTLSRWVTGKSTPKPETLQALRELHSKYMVGVDSPVPTGRITRDEAIVRMHRRGDTLQEIGDIYNLTRERVRQIVAAYREGQ
ncbi:hypothetical protein DOI34_24415 [Salmonella enterica subsp. enterica serovar Virchow]|nr:hypothetical protein [Salmonella enterica subsp. enterica serovar Java]EBV3599711.1 hypothetical protein [Salmonella enterica subsp. enterica serovar Virchow]EBX4816824.1 hypothetical protein [Salmonella enterica subsp. enterica serovar Newport]EFG8199630.1 helix-turn-helix domain-containing protein [Escherichia coli]MIL09722.1 helix-turn-helix domain-containing protein [Salmonella enterica subsp. enterica serovar Enteritidis]